MLLLHAAVFNGNEVQVRLLLEKGADARTRNWEYGFSTLYQVGNVSMAELLL